MKKTSDTLTRGMYFQRLFIILGVFLLCSCAGTGQKRIVNVPGQNVSFVKPPSDWQVNIFTSTSKVPAGGFLPIKLFKASWGKSNLSTIGITGSNISGIRMKGSTRDGLLSALDGEIKEFKKVCGYVKHQILDETSGSLRKGIDYTGMEADILCFLAETQDPLKARTVLYVVESADYLYTLQFKAIERHYEKDIPAFQKVLASITFADQ